MMIRLSDGSEVYLEHKLREAYDLLVWALEMLDEKLGRDQRDYDWHRRLGE